MKLRSIAKQFISFKVGDGNKIFCGMIFGIQQGVLWTDMDIDLPIMLVVPLALNSLPLSGMDNGFFLMQDWIS